MPPQKSGRSTTTCTHTLPRNCQSRYPACSQWTRRREASPATAWEDTELLCATSKTPACTPPSPLSLQSAIPLWCPGERRPSLVTWALWKQERPMMPQSWFPPTPGLRCPS